MMISHRQMAQGRQAGPYELLARGCCAGAVSIHIDLSQQKPRPAIVVLIPSYQQRTGDVILIAISSKVPASLPEGEFVLAIDSTGFAETGLRVTSVVRPGKIVTMHQSLIIMRLGQITPDVIEKLDEQLRKVLGLRQARGIWDWRRS